MKRLAQQLTAIVKRSDRVSMKVIELFAGVGGFRVALERANKHIGADYKVIWSNQWEPATKAQHASNTYVARFGSEGHSNEDITQVVAEKIDSIPDHDLLVGGFPCQDYSVARTLSQAAGIEGKKGVLWWSIYGILDKKEHKPDYLMLENVDRLINSPASQRGRDFAIILASLADLGYIAEWRVVNAADYGFPQRRRRTFILAYRQTSKIGIKIQDALKWLTEDGVMVNAFPTKPVNMLLADSFDIKGDLPTITERFNKTGNKTPFLNTGIIIGRKVFSMDTEPNYNGSFTTLGDILLPTMDVPESFFIKKEDLPRWRYLKGAKQEMRRKSNGFEYHYSEGSMQFPDLLDRPSRTIITGEGGASPSRFKHVVQTEDGRYRRLTPIELERLDMFPDNHTAGVSDVKRAFFMGNALVVGAIQNMAESLYRSLTS